MKHFIGLTRKLSLMAVLIITVLSCQSEKLPSFGSAQEAVTALRGRLVSLRQVNEINDNKMADIIADWRLLKDSAFAAFERDTVSIRRESSLGIEYITIEDSIIMEINRIGGLSKHTIKGVLNIKARSARKNNTLRHTVDYTNALSFYDKINESQELLEGVETTLGEYYNILSETLQTEQDLYAFIKKEDLCFRSLLNNLTDISQNDLQSITEKTSSLLDELYMTVLENPEDGVNRRLLIYLTLRYNRRIIQNASVCAEDIQNGKELTNQQKVNYRWMLMQPFMSIDFFASSLLTDAQLSELQSLADRLPSLLLSVDGGEATDEERAKLSEELADYFMRSFLISSL